MSGDLDIARIRADFPVFGRIINGKPLVYLDNAATTLKPKQVVDVMSRHYLHGASNVHRGVHRLSEEATRDYENAREQVRSFINAPDTSNIVFTSGTTAGINVVARGIGTMLQAGDEVVISHMEHHANIVPWQMIRDEKGIVLKVVPINDAGELDMEAFAAMIGPRTRFVSMVWVSNALGTINPVAEIVRLAHSRDIPVLLDAAQAVAHMAVDVQALDVDFLVFSGHKLFGPTGTGVLYGKRAWLDRLPPLFGGGDMIRSVTFEKTTYAPAPLKFEAGTPHIAGVIGLGEAIRYVLSIGLDRIAAWEHELLDYGTQRLQALPGLRLIGTAKSKASVLGFVLDDIHPHDIGSILDQHGVAVRTGHHCAQPVMQHFKVPATARASLSFYNTRSDIDALVEGIRKTQEMFA